MVVHGSDGTFRYQAKVSAGDARASVSPAARERVRTTVTIPPDVLEAAERHMARHGSKLQEAVLALARLGGREEQRRAEVERLAAQRRAIVRGRRRSGSSQTWPNPTELRSAILDED